MSYRTFSHERLLLGGFQQFKHICCKHLPTSTNVGEGPASSRGEWTGQASGGLRLSAEQKALLRIVDWLWLVIYRNNINKIKSLLFTLVRLILRLFECYHLSLSYHSCQPYLVYQRLSIQLVGVMNWNEWWGSLCPSQEIGVSMGYHINMISTKCLV